MMPEYSVRCGWCGGPTETPSGTFLTAVANGRTICSPCGRFQVECTCRERRPTLRRYERADRPGNAVTEEWIAGRVLAGWSPRAIAVAGGFSMRTAYRWVRDLLEVRTVAVGGYEAPFALRRGKPPLRLAEWRSRTEA